MAAAPLPRLQELDVAALSRFGVLQGTGTLLESANARALGWPELERLLPDRGLPRGVVEIASAVTKPGSAAPHAMTQMALRGGATTIALAALRAAHEADAKAWCAWVTPSSIVPSLYAPSVAQAGVDLDRLLVVRPSPTALARAVVKVAASGAFDVVVVDAFAGLDGRLGPDVGQHAQHAGGRVSSHVRRPPKVDGSLVVRRLALSAEEHGTTFVLLTNAYAARPVPWPVALRLEVERRPEAIAVRVTKDRRGRATDHGDLRASMHVVRVPC